MIKQKGVYIITQEEVNNVLQLYNEKIKSINFISKLYKVDNSVIKKILLDNNITIRNNNIYKNKECNIDYFEIIDTEDKAYWLGFIYADGCITKNKYNRQIFEIKLKISDINHLYKLKSALQSSHKIISARSNSKYSNNSECCGLHINSIKLTNDLYNLGVLYNKSKILKPPTILQVPQNLISHFIRGYFDGDGSVYEYSKTHEGSVSFVGTKDILEWILQNIQTCVNTHAKVYKYKNKDIYEVKIGGINNFTQIYKYLYINAKTYLDRKKIKYEHILQNNQIDVQRL